MCSQGGEFCRSNERVSTFTLINDQLTKYFVCNVWNNLHHSICHQAYNILWRQRVHVTNPCFFFCCIIRHIEGFSSPFCVKRVFPQCVWSYFYRGFYSFQGVKVCNLTHINSLKYKDSLLCTWWKIKYNKISCVAYKGGALGETMY